MKKIFIALACNVAFGLHAQTNNTPVTSMIQPSKANGYICWDKSAGASFKVNVYQLVGGRYQLISSTKTSNSYFRFNSAQMASSDLYYSISVLNAGGTVVSESDPAQMTTNPPAQPFCSIDCNGLRESYRLTMSVKPNGDTYLTATDDATSYYQAIDLATYQMLQQSSSGEHPYVKGVAYGVNGAFVYARDHIQITPNTPGGPFYNANHDVVTDGWLVQKKMDKYANFQGVNTDGYFSPTTDWCEANIGTATDFFNPHMNPASMLAPNHLGTNQEWFLPNPTTNSSGQLIYQIPSQLTCTNMANGGGSVPGLGESMDEFFAAIDLCFDFATADSSDDSGDPTLCLIPDGGPFGGGGIGGIIHGVTFEPMDPANHYRLSIDNSTGRPTVLSQEGRFTPGLYRMNVFLTEDRIVPYYYALGVPNQEVQTTVDLVIVPNPIEHSILKFDVTANANAAVSILVQKLDGTTVYTESAVNLRANRTEERSISITGDTPYNQLRVSVILEDGTVIRQTAITQ